MEADELRSLFDREVRCDPPDIPGYHVERVGSIVRHIGPTEWCILYARPEVEEIERVIREQIEAFPPAGRFLEWKVYSHDGLPELSRGLAEHGFRSRPHETLMIRDLEVDRSPGRVSEGVEVRRVQSETEFQDFAAVDLAAFGTVDPVHLDEIHGRIADPRVGLYLAYVDGQPAGGGRVEVETGKSFAGLWGGGTAPAFRRRGIYRELVRVRAEFARSRGARYLYVEAIDTTSRPLLEKMGFTPLAGVEGWVLGSDGTLP